MNFFAVLATFIHVAHEYESTETALTVYTYRSISLQS